MSDGRDPEAQDPIASCIAEATRQIEERDRLAEKRQPLVAHYNAFVLAQRSLHAVRGDVAAQNLEGNPDPLDAEKVVGGRLRLAWAIGRELDRTAKEMNALVEATGVIALPSETIEDATIRIARERGINPSQWAKLLRPELTSGEVAVSNERRDARESEAKYAQRYRADLELLRRLVSLARAGDVWTLHHERHHTFNAPYPIETAIAKWEQEIARLEKVIGNVTPRRGRPKKAAPPEP